MMARFFIPRTWRLRRVVFFLIIFELPFTVANLALFGIASPNLYRTILWRVGGEMGFNSDPTTVLYAYANYRPVTIPLVWSNFNTQYHLVIGVVCTFFYLIKSTMWLLKVFVPIISLGLHTALLCLWAYGLHIQTAPDTIDPQRINNGAPWYLTKSCNIVQDKNIRAYCMQAKASFAVTIIMMAIYAIFLGLTIYSLIPTREARQAHNAKQAEKKAEKEKWANSPSENDMSAEEQWQHMWELQQLPRTPGTVGGMKSPMTPRTKTFNELGGTTAYTQLDGARKPGDLETGQYGYGYGNSNLQPVQTGYGNGNLQPVQTAWYGGAPGATQNVSPIAEQEEYTYEGKGKRNTMSAY